MSMPEFVIQYGVQRAWEFFKENSHAIGYLMKELPVDKRERYRQMIEDEDVSIILAYPTAQTRLPSFAIVLSGESEEIDFLDDGGDDDSVLPYPSPGLEDIEDNPYLHEGYDSVTYERDFGPQLSSVDGAQAKETIRPVLRTQLPRKNLDYQRTDLGQEAPENFEKMGETERLFDRNTQKVSSRSWVDRISVSVIVTTQNAEKTFIYYRLLRWSLRMLKMWFAVNGIQNLTFTGSDLSPNEQLAPAPSPTVFQRTLMLSFQHEDKAYEVEAFIRKWIFDIKLAVQNADGSVDYTVVFDDSDLK